MPPLGGTFETNQNFTNQCFAISLTVIAAYSDTDGRRLDENREIDLVFAARSRRI
jgi:hypothetical protein